MQTRVELARDELANAKQALTELAKIVEGGTLPPMVQLACHAALPASDRDGLDEPAYAILKAAVNLQIQTATGNRNSNANDLALGRLVSKVNRHLSSEPAQVKKFFENYLVGRQSYYSRYSGTYGQYLQWQDWANIAEEAGKNGLPTVALDYMGRVADFSYENRARPSTTTALAVVCREMSLMPAEKRYEAWRDWTLPAEGRQTVRLAAEWVEPVRVPKPFLAVADVRGQLHSGGMLCNFTELLAAAEASARMAELRERVKAAHDEKLENAEFLYALLLIQLDDIEAGKPVIEPLVKTIGNRLKRQSNQPTPDGWGDYLVYRSAMRSDQFSQLYSNKTGVLRRGLQALYKTQTLSRVHNDYAMVRLRKRGSIRPGDDPQLAHWFPASTRESVPTGTDPWWVVQEGHIAHLTGSGSDLLYFAYPLTGEFEFKVDAYDGAWTETDAGYGGITVEAQINNGTTVWSNGGHESIRHPKAMTRVANGYFGNVTIKVANGTMQYVLNNHVVYEEKLSGTSPWVTLYTFSPRSTTFRNPRFVGTPTIPREVTLVNGDRMDGWNTTFFTETQPRRRIMAMKPKSENDSLSYQQRDEPAEFDWRADDGLLIGRAQAGTANTQSWAYYHRPLQNRESFSYEFHYVPGESVAHPSIGRIALLLEPDGVAEHWIGRPGWDEAVIGLAEDNRLANADARRGPLQLPLKPGDWNRVQLSFADEAVQVTLNDELVYERALEAEVDHRFGLYRGKSQSLKVREPKLTGAWPESLTDIRDDLLASTKKYNAMDRRAINVLLGERFFERDTRRIIAEARALPPDQAYEKLLAWVLPSSSGHTKPRLYFDFAMDDDGVQEIVCPAYELLAAADAAGTLDDLSEAIAGLKSERGRFAMQALLALHRGQLDAARDAMAPLYDGVAKGLSKFMAVSDRSIEYVVVWQAVKHPALHFASLDIAHQLRDKQRDNKFKAAGAEWEKRVDILVGHVDREMMSKPSGGESLTQWASVPYYKPDMHANGYRHTEWFHQRGIVQHVPGGTWSQLFFQSPLRGNFEIRAERAMHGHREVAMAYGMHSAEPRYDYKAKRISKVMHASRDIDGEIEGLGPGLFLGDFRIVVKDNQVTTFVNDVQLHEETLSPQPDPWVLLQSHSPGYPSTVRNLRIVGNPEIPDEIDLIDIAGWASWRADMYGESFTLDENGNAPWKKVGDEIRGVLRANVAAAYRESLLMYQRPMLEDGEIEFESFYLPGEFEVHAAVGRTALMVGSDGVRKHVLTNAQYETSQLGPGNSSEIEGAADTIVLKEKGWNRFKLSLKENQLTLAVNGNEVATVTLTEPSTERYFGLFRYANKTKCRVRNLVYRGDWPKTLPPLEEQQLAWPTEPIQFAKSQTIDLSEPIEKLNAAGVQLGGRADHVTSVDRGMRLLLQKSEGYGSWPRLHLRKPIEGDCIVTLDFEDLKLVFPKEGWGCNFVLRAVVDDVWIDAGIGGNVGGNRNIHSVRRHKTMAGKDKHDGRYQPDTVDSGRLRLVRSGPIISTYYAAKGSDNFRLWEMWPVGDGPIREITVQTAASDAATVIDVVVNQLMIQTGDALKTTSLGN